RHIPTTELYPLSLHDALPIFSRAVEAISPKTRQPPGLKPSLVIPIIRQVRQVLLRLTLELFLATAAAQKDHSAADFHRRHAGHRSEEHTSELQSRGHLVCRLL